MKKTDQDGDDMVIVSHKVAQKHLKKANFAKLQEVMDKAAEKAKKVSPDVARNFS